MREIWKEPVVIEIELKYVDGYNVVMYLLHYGPASYAAVRAETQ